MFPNCFFEGGPNVEFPYVGDISSRLDVDTVSVKYVPVPVPEGDGSFIGDNRGGLVSVYFLFFFVNSGLGAGAVHLMAHKLPSSIGAQCLLELS